MTQNEYEIAIALEREGRAPADDLGDYWQLIQFYRGEIFRRDAAERALLRIRANSQ